MTILSHIELNQETEIDSGANLNTHISDIETLASQISSDLKAIDEGLAAKCEIEIGKLVAD